MTRQKQAVKQKQKLLLKQIRVGVPRVPAVIPGRVKVPPISIRKKKVRRIVKRKPQKIGYNVFGKSRGKFIRLNKVPLSKADALSRGSFAIDRTTGATFKIKGVGKVKKLGK